LSSTRGGKGGKRLAKVIAIVAAGAVIATLGTAYALDQINRYGEVPCPPEPGPSSSDMDSASAVLIGFTSMEEIITNADVIAVADVESCIKVHSHPKAREIRLTDFQVRVAEIVKGDLPASGTATVQLITSGSDADYHVMKAGERYVFFLASNQVTSGYSPVGGPQGRFLVSDNQVYSMDAIYSDLGFINVSVDGQPLDDFLAEIKAES
jgi:hypothetical protein